MRRRNDDLNLFAIMGATALGTMLGVTVGLLFAPRPGEEIRGEIATAGKDLYKKAKAKKSEFFNDLEDDIEDKIEEFEDELDD